MNIVEKLILAIGAVGLVVLISFLLSWPVYALWNECLVGAVSAVREITWMQAWGINILFSILFKTNLSTKS